MSEKSEHILYVDHSFHQHSKSTVFFQDALERNARVTKVWDGAWEGRPPVQHKDVASLGTTRAVFFQTYPTADFLAQYQGPVVVIPMFDSPASEDELRAMAAYRVTAICFSKAAERIYRDAGIDVLPIQFSPAPGVRHASEGPPNVFFWERGAVTWADVKTLLGEQKLGKVYLKMNPDPDYAASTVTEEDRRRYDLEVITDWLSKEAYDAILDRCQVYVAPRLAEGIGMSFLEAMARGLTVIAADRPTMNEYIVDGENGLLFDLPIAKAIDLSDARGIGERAYETVVRLHETYEARLQETIDAVLRLQRRPPDRRALLASAVRIRTRPLRMAIRSLRGRA